MTTLRFFDTNILLIPSAATRVRSQSEIGLSRSSTPAATRCRSRCCRNSTCRQHAPRGPMRFRMTLPRGLFEPGCALRCRKFPCQSCPGRWRSRRHTACSIGILLLSLRPARGSRPVFSAITSSGAYHLSDFWLRPSKRLHELFKGRIGTTAYQSIIGSDE
jgi:hypothetical protein